MQLVDELAEDERVDVLAQLVEKEPISHPDLATDSLDLVERRQAATSPQQHLPHTWHSHHSQSVSHLDACDDADGDEPEPEEDVDLLVNDVQGENAEAVKFLDRS